MKRASRPLARTRQRVLVVGAGIAGSATAFMLARSGYDATIIDAAEAPYEGGYQILLDPTALEIMEQLGVQDIAHELSAPDPLVSLRRNGSQIAEFEMTGYRMARRGDLVGRLSTRFAESVPTVFGKELVGIEQRLDAVRAHFADGSEDEYDFIVGADGLGSTVRRLALESNRSSVHINGRICLWVNVPGHLEGPSDAAVLTGNRLGALVFPYPDKDETLVVTTVQMGARHRFDAADLQPLAADLLAGSGSDLAHFVDSVRHAPQEQTRVTAFAQVRAPRWHSRRVVLVGDAAHCIDPLSGLGAHGGLLGGSILAQELRRTPQDFHRAADRYQRRTRRFVSGAQRVTAGLMEIATARGLGDRLHGMSELVQGAGRARPVRAPRALYAGRRR
ncbi:FAD-dependent oxidoreductase [Microbacterium sp. PF5]|uniref:FAD-dependent oxidoreductase n=1 Tax=Microbacterium sp. PF5 TaxID=2305435 RepID=UPI0014442DFF|nr:NAD(P)/FAD-dependent oxidoreductase [Microbacterium sp. PF5]